MITFIPVGVLDQNTDDPSQALLSHSSDVISFKETLRRSLMYLDWNDEQIQTVLDELHLKSDGA